MTDAHEPTFSVEEALTVQRRMRELLGLGAERFPLTAFVGMISDEIEQLRRAGKTDRDIADLVNAATGKSLQAEDIAMHYAPPEQRRAR